MLPRLCWFASIDVTVKVYTLSLKECIKSKYLLEAVSSSAEFETISICCHKDTILLYIYNCLPAKLEQANFEAPYFKTFLLLQAHFSHLQLPPNLASDQLLVLKKVLNLLLAYVDTAFSNTWLNAFEAMDLSQMYMQSMWKADSPLKQTPHFESKVGLVVFIMQG